METIKKQNRNIEVLAKREREVFEFLVKGFRTKDIGEKLNLKANTVSSIKKVIQRKLGAENSIELYKIAQENKILL